MTEKYHGIQRDKIPWHPKVNYTKCINCGICIDYCKLGVYDVEEEQKKKKPIVQNPNNCVVFCTGCEGKCPSGAISFPSKPATRQIIKKLKDNELS
jgi:NAD-dependent dihydropyrimidine dehydrogenase PreA subunit